MTKNYKDVCLVVPTIRENCIRDFLSRWKELLGTGIGIIVVEDNPSKTFDIESQYTEVMHFSWEDIRKDLGEQEWIIPRRSDTVRSYGYWKAWKFGYTYTLTLDDDCYPPTYEKDEFEYEKQTDFLDAHLNAIHGKSKWFNTLDRVKPRGIPFYNVGRRNDIILNHGLWVNVLDYDAPTQLVSPTKEKFAFDNKIVPHGSFFPMCGMNVMWKTEFTPWMYHLLMGHKIQQSDFGYEPSLRKLPFDRFGDIFCGIIMKKCADLFGVSVTTGTPYIRHERASNPFTNLKKEANGLEVNEKFWEYIDNFSVPVTHRSPSEVYGEMGSYVAYYNEFPEYRDYFVDLGQAMQIWADLFK